MSMDIRYRLTQLSLSDLLASANIAKKDLSFLEDFKIKYTDIEKFRSEFVECHISIEAAKKSGFNSVEHDERYSSFMKNFYEIKSIYNTLFENIASNVSSHGNKSFKLPHINLPTFNGDIANYLNFISLFKSLIHNNKTLDDVQKLHYLIGCLKADALDIVKYLPICESNYNVAINLLEKRYGNQRRIANKHIDKITELPDLKITSEMSLRTFVNIILENLEALRALNFPVQEWSFLLLNIISKKLTSAIVTDFELSHNKELPTFDDLLKFLEHQCNAIETNISVHGDNDCSKINRKNHPSSVKPGHGKSYKSTFATSVSEKCKCCNNYHPLYACNKFKVMSMIERKSLIKQHNLCFNCFGVHLLKDCTSKSTCKVCSKRHHTLLHNNSVENNMPSPSHVNENSDLAALNSTMIEKTVLLATAIINIKDNYGNDKQVRALIDNGSQCSFITESCVQSLKLRRTRNLVSINGVGEGFSQLPNGTVQCIVKPLTSSTPVLTFNALILKRITNHLPTYTVPSEIVRKFSHLELADKTFFKRGQIDILLGADVYQDIILDGTRVNISPNLPSAYPSIFGWIILGRTGGYQLTNKANNFPCSPTSENIVSHSVTLNTILNKFWEIEEVPQITMANPDDSVCENHFINTHQRDTTGRFVVSLPFKSDASQLGESYQGALKQFYYLEKKLSRDSAVKAQYCAFLKEYSDLGHMEICNHSTLDNIRYFIPHHGVFKESSTTKLRVVFNASMPSSSGISLNDILLAGPKLQTNIVDVILRFRVHKIVFTADIKQMYRQIMVNENERKYQMILWRQSPKEPIQQYQLNTVTYGITSSPYLAIRCLRELAELNKSCHPKSSKVITKDIFVDDIITGSPSLDEAVTLRHELVKVLKGAGFELRKWSSNSSEFLKDLPQEVCEPLTFDSEQDSFIKILGIKWNASSDAFSFNAKIFNLANTKRAILSNIARIYDPCGILTPVTFTAKFFMQELWLSSVGWDDDLPNDFLQKWEEYVTKFPVLNNILFKRHILPNHPQEIQVHGFCDASEKGYAAAIYLRVIQCNGEVTLHLLVAKSRVSPVKQRLTIPRLELCGAVLLAKLLHQCQTTLAHIKISSCTAWCDSNIVLCWIKTSPHTLKIYEGNRVSLIHQLLAPDSWRYVPSKLNPADCASRGLMPDQLIDHPLWWNPSWLSNSSETWPKTVVVHDASISNIPLIPTNAEPISSSLQSFSNAIEIEFNLLHRYSSLGKLVRVTSLCLRFIKNLKVNTKTYGPVSVMEWNTSLNILVKIVQQKEFSNDIKLISQNKLCSTRIRRLKPFMDSKGFLRVGGRLNYSDFPYKRKHPLLLPRSHILTYLLIDYYHIAYLHAGPTLLISVLQTNFWILSARDVVRHRIFKCIRCFRLKPRSLEPVMAPLPPDRVRPSRAFLKVGVDMAGPIVIKANTLRKANKLKAYLCVFVCFCTKAVHLELVSNLSTESFLAAFDRFTSRRGLASDVYSDCGTNFVGSRNHLLEVQNFYSNKGNSDKISFHLTKNQINWHLNAPASPHMGGLWEAAVKSAKTYLKRVIGDQCLTFEELTTLFTRIEAILNSRPLCPLSNDPSDLAALTPGHFLIGESLLSVPEYDFSDLSVNRLSRWQMLRKMMQHFWQRWRNEYLHNLQQRVKWQKSCNNVKINDLVLIKDNNSPPLQWKLGRIIELSPGPDGVVRVVSLKTASGIITRPVVKLCPLSDIV